MTDLWRDVRLVVGRLQLAPLITTAAALTLALGVATNSRHEGE